MRRAPAFLIVALVAAAAVSGAALLVPFPHPAPPPSPSLRPGPVSLSLPALASAQLTATATQELKRTVNFYQNGTGSYAGSSQIATFPTAFATAGNYSSVSSFAESFSEASSNNYYPQTNVTQGTTVLTNATVSLPYTLAPAFSSTSVKARVVELYSATSGLPTVGTYSVAFLAAQSIAYTRSTALNWSDNASVYYTADYSLAAAPGYWLNQSQLFLPFPALATGVNWSTVTVLLNGTAYGNFQAVSGGIFVNVPSIGPGYAAAITARFQASPAISGAAPVLVVSTYTVLNATYDQINVSWTDQMQVAYAGEYIIQTHFAYGINPSTLSLQAGTRAMPSGSWAYEGDTLIVFPLEVTVAAGSAITFFVDFQFVSAPPLETITADTVAFGTGTGSVTWGTITLGAWILFGLSSAVTWGVGPELVKRRGADWSYRHRAAVTLTVAAVVAFAIWFLLLRASGGVP